MFIDTHCHLTSDNYDEVEKLILEISPNIIIVNGVNQQSSIEAVKLAHKYNHVYAAIGIHPSEIDELLSNEIEFIEKYIDDSKVVAIGEIGLDYYWKKDNKLKQQYFFKKQIELALEYNKPLIIHSRESIEDTYNILTYYSKKNPNLSFVLHCYGSSIEMAERFLKMNVMFGIGGVVTFKNEKKLKEVVKKISLNNILLETDSPYLSPEPLRGKINTPKNIILVAKKIAEIKEEKYEKVIEITTENAISKFDLKV